MKIDLYTKSMLTIIAVGIVALVIQNFTKPAEAQSNFEQGVVNAFSQVLKGNQVLERRLISIERKIDITCTRVIDRLMCRNY
jgi:hypothetical protein